MAINSSFAVQNYVFRQISNREIPCISSALNVTVWGYWDCHSSFYAQYVLEHDGQSSLDRIVFWRCEKPHEMTFKSILNMRIQANGLATPVQCRGEGGGLAFKVEPDKYRSIGIIFDRVVFDVASFEGRNY
jgi:hypothetical protein